MTPQLLRTVSWRSRLWEGTETCSLFALADGWELRGSVDVVLGQDEGFIASRGPDQESYNLATTYFLQADAAWATRRVSVEVTCASPRLRNTCTLIVGRNGLWKQKSGNRAPNLQYFDDALDFSMDISAGLYTQQIRRLDLAVGDDDDLGAARLNIPGLAADLIVTYVARTGDATYAFTEELPNQIYDDDLTVDDLGMIVACERWERIYAHEPLAGSGAP